MDEPTIEIDPISMLRARRTITGISAVLLPFTDAGAVDRPAFEALLTNTVDAGLTPAVNMDTGYVNLLSSDQREELLDVASATLAGAPFCAGAFVDDVVGAPFAPDAHRRAMESIERRGGTPVVFPSYGLSSLDAEALVAAFAAIGRECDRFIAFELGTMFAPFGRIFGLDVVRELMGIASCVGMKHSSLDRVQEWQRLLLRDEVRPDFHVFTGNDLAIDMVMYGSDYLLGLSAFAPDAFARRDRLWATGDPRFYEHNDVLQYLGCFAFRDPVPAYKHTAAQFLALRGWITSDAPHPDAQRRPDSDRAILRGLLARIEQLA